MDNQTPDATGIILKAIDAKFDGLVKKGDLADFATKSELQAAVTGQSNIEAAITNLKNEFGDLSTKAQMSFGNSTAPKDWAAELPSLFKSINPETKRPYFENGKLAPVMTKALGTMTLADDLTSGAGVLTYSQTQANNPTRKVNVRNILPIIPSATGIFPFYREGAIEGGFGLQTPGQKKNVINARWSQVTITTDYLAGLAPIAKQMAQDLPFIQNFISTFLIREYLKQEDATFWPLLTNLTTGATGSRVISGNPTSDVEQLLGWMTNLLAADHDPNLLVMHPADLYRILITKGSVEYGLPNAVTVSAQGAVSVMGVPIQLTTGITAGRVYVGDSTKAGIVQTDGLAVSTDDRGDNFDNNTITYKAEARVGIAIMRPDAFIYGDLNGTT